MNIWHAFACIIREIYRFFFRITDNLLVIRGEYILGATVSFDVLAAPRPPSHFGVIVVVDHRLDGERCGQIA